jgi:hypothetical protein
MDWLMMHDLRAILSATRPTILCMSNVSGWMARKWARRVVRRWFTPAACNKPCRVTMLAQARAVGRAPIVLCRKPCRGGLADETRG